MSTPTSLHRYLRQTDRGLETVIHVSWSRTKFSYGEDVAIKQYHDILFRHATTVTAIHRVLGSRSVRREGYPRQGKVRLLEY